jgi:hypothetical protein
MKPLNLFFIFMIVSLPLLAHANAPSNDVQRLTDSIGIQENAIQLLTNLTARPQTSAVKTAALLQRTIENEEKLAALEFELANAIANQGKIGTALDLVAYKKTLARIVQTCSTYLNQFPKTYDYLSILLIRGKNNQLLERNELAQADYERVAFSLPRTSQTAVGAVALVDFQFDLGNYAKVINTVEKLGFKKTDPYFVEVQLKRAAAQSKTQLYEASIKTTQVALAAAVQRSASAKTFDPESLKEAVTIASEMYVTAYVHHVPGISIDSIVQAFKNTVSTRVGTTTLENLTIQFITNGQEEALFALEKRARELVGEKDLPAALGKYYLLRLEHQFDHRLISGANDSMAALKPYLHVPEFEQKNSARLYRILTHGAEMIHTGRIKMANQSINKGEEQATDLCVLSAYQMAMTLKTHSPEDSFALDYNAAEIAYRLQNFALATQYYQQAKAQKAAHPKTADVDLKIISSRYQELLAKNIFPNDLKPVSVHGSEMKKAALDPAFQEWITWIDQDQSEKPQEKTTLAQFKFEAARAFYTQYDTGLAIEKLAKIMVSAPENAVSLKAMYLYFDTAIQSKEWEHAVQQANGILAIIQKNPAALPELVQKIKTYRDDADAEIVSEAFVAQNFPLATARGNEHLSHYPESSHLNDIRIMLGLSAVKQGKSADAQVYFGKADLTKATAETKSLALANSIDSSLQSYRFPEMITAYLNFVQNGDFKNRADKQKAMLSALQIAWVAEDAVQLRKTLAYICNQTDRDPSVKTACADDLAWLSLIEPRATRPGITGKEPVSTFGRTVEALLKTPVDAGTVAEISKVWNTFSTLQKFALIPYVEKTLSLQLVMQRNSIRAASPIKLQKEAINKRAALLANLEKLKPIYENFHWAALQYHYLKLVAIAYQDFASDIQAIAVPKDFQSAEKENFKKMLSENSAPFQTTAIQYDSEAMALHLKKSNGFNFVQASTWITYGKANPNFQIALNQAIQEKNVLNSTYLLEVGQKSGLFKDNGDKVLMATLLTMSGGDTESEALFAETKIQAALAQFSSVDVDTRKPAAISHGGSK